MNYRNPVIAGYLSAIPVPSAGMPTCWTMKCLLCSRASASGFTVFAWGCAPRATVQRTPALLIMKDSIIPIPKEMPYESTTTT